MESYTKIIGCAFYELPKDKQEKARKRLWELKDKENDNFATMTFAETCELEQLENYILGVKQ